MAKAVRATRATVPAGTRGKRSPSANRRVSADERRARLAVVETAQRMSAIGLSPGRSGNVSCRFDTGMLITPSGMAYDTLTPDDMVFVDADGSVPQGARKPSSEWQFHLAALKRRPDRHAVVHTHSRHALILACRHEPIPAFHYMVAAAGGVDIPCVPYAIFGSAELSDHVANGLTERDACLMANHGMTAIGETLDAALELARDVEELAAQYIGVLQLGKPKRLNAKQMAEVLERFKGYGQRAQTAEAS